MIAQRRNRIKNLSPNKKKQLHNHLLLTRDEKERNSTVSSAYLAPGRRLLVRAFWRFDAGALEDGIGSGCVVDC
jgi:hypothetical protein